jgi:HAD superfamily hydrolase (TIGR01509 family)
MYKAIGFDYGGVLEVYEGSHPFAQMADKAGVSIEDLRRAYLEHNHLANVHSMSWFDVVRKVFTLLNVPVEKQESALALDRDYYATARLNTELLDVVVCLRAEGFKTGILSNAWAARREDFITHDIDTLFDVTMISGEIGAQKPHKEAFEPFIGALGVEPAELIFIDDSPFSLAKAGEIGYTPILYKNNEHLFADLRELGISV